MKKTTLKNRTIDKPAGASGAPFEYKMPKAMAEFYLKSKPANIEPMSYLCGIVTESYGLMGWCCRVSVEG